MQFHQQLDHILHRIMANKPTEYTTQYFANKDADTGVNPPVWRIGLLGKADDGSYYTVKCNTDGSIETVLMAEDSESPGTYLPIQGKHDANGYFVLLTGTSAASYFLLTEGGDNSVLEDGLTYRVSET
jgi:hypothetical protein